MENRIETFAMESEQVYETKIEGEKNSHELYDELLRSFIRDPNDRNLIPNVTLDSFDLADYLKLRCCDGVNAQLLNEFWSWVENS